VFILVLHYFILDNALHYLTQNTGYTHWSVVHVAWLNSVSIFKQWGFTRFKAGVLVQINPKYM